MQNAPPTLEAYRQIIDRVPDAMFMVDSNTAYIVVAPQNTLCTNYSQARERLTFNVVSTRKRSRDGGLRRRATAGVQNGSPTSSRAAARG